VQDHQQRMETRNKRCFHSRLRGHALLLENRSAGRVGKRPQDGIGCAVHIIRAPLLHCVMALPQDHVTGKKMKGINALDGYDAILTRFDAVSMVRAAFEGDGASFPSTAASFRVSAAWLMARKTAEMAVAINRPMRLRFPQGSEVWITGCPKFGTAEKSRLTSPETSRTRPRPRHPPWLSGFASLPNWSPAFLSERLSVGVSIACCRPRPGASSCFSCSASSPAWSTW
jgi:hypothetical protein